MTTKVERLLRRHNFARSQSDGWRSLFCEAYNYAVPDRNTFNTRTRGDKKNAQVFDTTAVRGLVTFASKLQNTLTPPRLEWATLQGGPELTTPEKEAVAPQLEAATKTLFNFINRSNFDLAINETYFDLGIGTGALQILEGTDDNPLNFVAVSLEFISFEEGPYGTIDTVWRRFESIPIRNITTMWPDATLPDVLTQRLQSDPNAVVDLIEGMVKRETQEKGESPFNYVVMSEGIIDPLVDRDIDSNLWVVYRWSRTPTELFGRGPVIQALPTIRTLNKVIEFEMKAAQLAIAPPYMAFRSGAFNPWTAVVEPNSIIPVDPVGGAELWPIRPLINNPNVEFGQLLVNDLRAQVNALMFTDPLGPIDAPVRTATEITIRQQEFAEQVGPAFGRLQVELLAPIIDRCIFILQKKKLLPPIEINGREISLRYKSPLALSQEQVEVTSFQQFFATLAQVVGPELAIGALQVTELPPLVSRSLWCGS